MTLAEKYKTEDPTNPLPKGVNETTAFIYKTVIDNINKAKAAGRIPQGADLNALGITAQILLESGNGSSELSSKYNNFGGIKADSNWKGETVELNNTKWRKYTTPEEGLAAQIDFYIDNPRYAENGVFNAKTPEEHLKAVAKAGYAGNESNYVTKTMEMVNSIPNRLKKVKVDLVPETTPKEQPIELPTMFQGLGLKPTFNNNHGVVTGMLNSLDYRDTQKETKETKKEQQVAQQQQEILNSPISMKASEGWFGSGKSLFMNQKQYGGFMNSFANGGPMQQLTEFNEGGTHEQNPLGGIPQGTGANGQPNLVEQGETKLNSKDYIFSDSLRLDKDVVSALNLSKTLVGKTFAEVSKKMNKPNSRRENDTIEANAISKDLDKLMEAQELFKQIEVEKKLAEIQSLDSNALGSLMGQGQAPMQQQPMEQPMGEQIPQEGMMKLGGYMYGNGGGLNYTVSNPNNLQQPPSEYMYPASAREAIQYKTQEEAMKGLFSGENDATRTYFNNPETGVMGEFIGNQDSKNTNLQDWGPEKSNSIVKTNLFMPTDGSYVDPTKAGKYGNGVITSYDVINNPNKKDFGGWLNDNKQGVVGGLQAAAGLGAMFIPGAQGLGTNLMMNGAKGIMREIAQDNQPKLNTQGVYNAIPQQQGLVFKYGGNMYDEGGLLKLRQQAEAAGQWNYDPGKPNIVDETKQGNYSDVDLDTINRDISVNQTPLNALGNLAPVVYNTAMALQKPKKTKLEDFYKEVNPIRPDYTAAENEAKNTYAQMHNSLRNSGLGAGSYVSNMQQANIAKDRAMSDIMMTEENAYNQSLMQTNMLNNQNLLAGKEKMMKYNWALDAARQEHGKEALTQFKDSQNANLQNSLATSYASLGAPDITKFTNWGYNPFFKTLNKSNK